MKIRGNSDYNRRQRQSNPYESSRPDRHNSYSDRASMALSTPRSRTEETTLKFLLTPLFAGVLIGTGGELIRELMKITGASVHVSNSTDYYPGTQLRTVYINGNEASVNLAQSLIWEMIGQQTNAVRENNRSLSWHPAAAKASPGEYDDEEVEGWITIPASAGGLIVGKAGSNLRHLHERSGIQLTIDTKEDAEATNERVLTLKGTAAGCMNCTFLVLSQLAADSNDYHYTLNGTTYKGIARRTHPVMSLSANTINSQLFTTIYNSNNNNNNSNSSNNSLSVNRSSSRTVVEISSARGRSGSFDLHSTAVPSFDLTADTSLPLLSTLSALTTIELAVPDYAVGGLLGEKRCHMDEIEQLSGATITVSKRGEFVEGTTNRKLTIVGTPACAQTAHTLIANRLRQSIEQDN